MKYVLYVPFYSMRSYSSGKWLLKRDGHATQCRNIINTICNIENEIYFDIVIPDNSDVEFKHDFFQLHDIGNYKDRVNLIRDINYAYNAFSERLNFNFKNWESILKRKQYDLIIYENIENVRNVRAIVGKDVEIISAITHGSLIDDKNFEKADNFYLRMIDGIYASDYVWYNADIMYKLKMLNLNQHKKLIPCFYYASYNEMAFDNFEKEKNSVLFLSRFSDSIRTNANLFMDIVSDNELNKQFKFHITNPSEVVLNPEIMKLNSEGKLTIDVLEHRIDYKNLLKVIETVVILYDTEQSFSTSYHEALMARCNVITLKHIAHFESLNENKLLIDFLRKEEVVNKLMKSINYRNNNLYNIVLGNYSVEYNYNKLEIL